MNFRRFLGFTWLLIIVARTAGAADVMFYKPGEMPDPKKVAAILNKAPTVAPRIKTRGLTLVPDHVATTEKATSSRQEAVSAEPESIAIPVRFAFNSSRILPDATGQLDAVAEGIMLAGPEVKVIIEGHTDGVGSAAYNNMLSLQRAQAVKAYLIEQHGIPATNLKVVGKGKSTPLNKDDPFAPENRRVEFRAAMG